MRHLPRPPQDLTSFMGRKWLELVGVNTNDLSALTELQYLLLASNAGLPNSRRLVGSANISLTDGGAGSTLTLNLVDTSVVPGTYNLVTVDQKGRITSGSTATVVSSVTNSDGTLTVSLLGTVVTVSLNLNHANTWLQDQSVPDEAYGVGWNGSLEVPTKNALYDKIETIAAGSSGSDYRNELLLGGM